MANLIQATTERRLIFTLPRTRSASKELITKVHVRRDHTIAIAVSAVFSGVRTVYSLHCKTSIDFGADLEEYENKRIVALGLVFEPGTSAGLAGWCMSVFRHSLP